MVIYIEKKTTRYQQSHNINNKKGMQVLGNQSGGVLYGKK